MSLVQLIYRSAATRELSEVELSRLLLRARVNNTALGVTGMLLYQKGSFLQVLEGNAGVVESLFDRIGKDSRHARVGVLLRREVDARQFSDWSMGFVDARRIADGLPGYLDFASLRDEPARAGGLAANVLAQFCEGRLRTFVDGR